MEENGKLVVGEVATWFRECWREGTERPRSLEGKMGLGSGHGVGVVDAALPGPYMHGSRMPVRRGPRSGHC